MTPRRIFKARASVGEDSVPPLGLDVQTGGFSPRQKGGCVLAKQDGPFFVDTEGPGIAPFADPNAGRGRA